MRGAVLLGLVLSTGCAAPAAMPEETPTPNEEPDVDGDELPVSGYLSTRYRGRFAGDEADHDVYQVAYVDVGDPESDRMTWHVMAQAAADLDGSPDEEDEFVFFSLADTYDSRVTGRVYHAYVDVHDSDSLDLLRFGRQQIYETPEFAYFDGVRAETPGSGDRRTRFGAYAGLPVHPYESSSSGDALLGLFAESRPWEGGRARVDWMHLEDENLLGEHRNDLLAMDVLHRFDGGVSVEAEYSLLEGDSRDARVTTTYLAPDGDLSVEASYYQLLTAQKDLAVPANPFFSTLFEYFPFRQVTLLASKGFGSQGLLQAGVDVRRVTDAGDVGEFNRDFERVFMTASFDGSVIEGLTTSFTGDVWSSPDDDIQTWGVDLSKDVGDVRASLGSYYSLFKYDLYSNAEVDHVRTSYLDLRHELGDDTTLRFRYEFEDADSSGFHTLRVGVTWRF